MLESSKSTIPFGILITGADKTETSSLPIVKLASAKLKEKLSAFKALIVPPLILIFAFAEAEKGSSDKLNSPSLMVIIVFSISIKAMVWVRSKVPH